MILKSGFSSAILRSHSLQAPQGAMGFNATAPVDGADRCRRGTGGNAPGPMDSRPDSSTPGKGEA